MYEIEKVAGSVKENSVDELNDLNDNFNELAHGLIDLPIGGRLYTWMNKAGTKLSKLDRFLISDEVLEIVLDIRITALDRLWLPIGSTMNCISSWKTLIARFQLRLSSWKASLLSIGGRLTLIKAVL
nr:RNA-directed DNA polymerase, eukaryota [Tanacetum cinerariifolium]